MRRLIIFIFTFLLLGPAINLIAQPRQGLPYVINYTRKDYMGSSQMWAITQDKRGIMYFGNAEGIITYDGEFWRTLYTTNQSTVRSLDIDKNDRIYIGAKEEFGYIEIDYLGRQQYISLLKYVEDPNKLDFRDIWNTYCTKYGVFFFSFNRAFLWKNNKITTFDFEPELNAHLSYHVYGELYIIRKKSGLEKFNGKDFIPVPGGEQFGGEPVFFMIPCFKDKILIGSKKSGTFLFSPVAVNESERFKKFQLEKEDQMLAGSIYHGIPLPGNRIAVATLYSGVFIYNLNGKLEQVVDKTSGLNNQNIKYLFLDNSEALWVAAADGISRIDLQLPFTFYDQSYGFEGFPRAIARNKGELYLATDYGVFCFDSLSNRFQLVDNFMDQCWEILDIGEGLLLGTSQGLFLIYDKKIRHLIKAEPVYRLFRSEFNKDRIFLGLKDGLVSIHFQNGDLSSAFIENYYLDVNEEIVSIAEEKNGDLWLGTQYQGLIRVYDFYNNRTLDTFNIHVKKYGLEDGIEINDTRVANFYDDVVILNGTKGLYGIEKQGKKVKFVPYEKLKNRDETFFKTLCTGLEAENENSYWSRFLDGDGNSGITNIFKKDNQFVSDNKLFHRIAQVLTKPEIIFPDEQGYVWFVSGEGVVKYNKKHKFHLQETFFALIREVQLGNDSIIFYGNYFDPETKNPSFEQPAELIRTFDYKNNSINFVATATSFETKGYLHYQYFLEGYDPDWTPWTDEFKKEYTNLPEGEYIFRVRCKNIYGIISQEATYRFTILAPWYRTFWAFAGYFILSVLIIFLIVHLYTRRLKKQKIKLEETVKQRTKEISKQKDQLEFQNNQIMQRNAEINAQNEEIAAQRDMLDNINKLLEKKNSDVTDSLMYAKRIQAILLPSEEQLNEMFGNYFVIFKPKFLVSGDFYWAGRKNNIDVIAAIDCTGHGVPGAFLSILAYNLMDEIVNDHGIVHAADILNELNRKVNLLFKKSSALKITDGMDITICSVDKSANKLEFAGAINPLYLVDENKNLRIIRGDRFPIGVYDRAEEIKFTPHVIEYDPGTMIFMSSDGYADQFGGERGYKLKLKKFRDLLVGYSDLPSSEQKKKHEQFLEKWMGYNDQVDDILVIGIKL